MDYGTAILKALTKVTNFVYRDDIFFFSGLGLKLSARLKTRLQITFYQ